MTLPKRSRSSKKQGSKRSWQQIILIVFSVLIIAAFLIGNFAF